MTPANIRDLAVLINAVAGVEPYIDFCYGKGGKKAGIWNIRTNVANMHVFYSGGECNNELVRKYFLYDRCF